jgi:NAD(P)-dependent dehydrogenase (short-subunit alcohol dehydrogenase family)
MTMAATNPVSDRVAIVTGGGGSLGRAIVRALVRSGTGVAVADRDLAAAREVETEIIARERRPRELLRRP